MATDKSLNKSTRKTRERERTKSRESQRGVKRVPRGPRKPEKGPRKPEDNKNPMRFKNPNRPDNKTRERDERVDVNKKRKSLNEGGKVTRSNNKGKRYI